ncbi:hypothetical protein SK3146_03955 [Paenibacillus konkukensis]|uniref:Uncharacterized protein n=1 Tax=Paenibacillus konkukensis TaxID=2020716 RepID=A0ABY4RRW7_9BACL|nr:hypothetical protein SK3146_03955 [Paenibacillus konkukensis]
MKDSYANCLIPFLTEHFSEIDVIDPRYYSDSIVRFTKEHAISDMLLLYNANTFFEDASVVRLGDEE